jgi:transposase-like protein
MREWRNRPLEKGYPYLVIDARYEKVRSGGRVVSSGVLIVTGIREDGVREILGVWVMPLESEATWSEVFKELKDRGLRDVIYTVSDDHKGLVAAIEKYFPEALWQRCQVHFMRNVLGKIRKADRKEVVNLLHGITEAATKEGALRGAKEAVERLAEDYPKAAEMIEENAEDILAVYELPESHRKKMRTTNMMERLNQELKRRTRVVRIFPSDGSCLRLTCALAMETSEEWEERRYLDMSELEEAGLAEAAREAVA